MLLYSGIDAALPGLNLLPTYYLLDNYVATCRAVCATSVTHWKRRRWRRMTLVEWMLIGVDSKLASTAGFRKLPTPNIMSCRNLACISIFYMPQPSLLPEPHRSRAHFWSMTIHRSSVLLSILRDDKWLLSKQPFTISLYL